jgi:hypothetical protein
MIENAEYIKDKSGYTELMVLSSAAGYYVGTMFNEVDVTGRLVFHEQVMTRDSGYYRTEQEAVRFLASLQIVGDDCADAMLRKHP